ncbi:MAG: septum formation initiator family protein [Candidatus Kapabacteria bacterium]|nr:septum formation initiator family protein [Candidatus Kapabacteria bacterium]
MTSSIIEKIKVLSKNKKIIFFASISCIVLAFLLLSNHGILKRIQLEKDKKIKYQEVNDEKHKTDSLKNLIEKLEKDTLEIERIARTHYGMIRPDEKVFFIKSN